MMFMVYRDGRGRYIQIETRGKTGAALGKELLALRYRACQDTAAQAATPPVAPASPAPAPRWVDVAGDRYVLNAFCKAHDCYDNSAVAVYQPDTGKALGPVQRSGRNVLVGGPPPQVAKELQRLWMAQGRQGGK